MEDLSVKELKQIIEQKKKKKRRMKTGKKALYAAYLICGGLILFTMAMIYQGKDTTSLTILAASGVGVLPIMYGIYEKHSTRISLKHMESNYIINYDEQEGIY